MLALVSSYGSPLLLIVLKRKCVNSSRTKYKACLPGCCGRKWEELRVRPSDETNETQKSQRADGIRRVVSVAEG